MITARVDNMTMTQELTMRSRSIVVGLAVLAFSASSALAAQRHHHAMNDHVINAAAPPAMPPPPVMWTGGFNSSDHATYLRNLRDSGYDPRGDYANGLIRTQ
jgi:hypothetical protein